MRIIDQAVRKLALTAALLGGLATAGAGLNPAHAQQTYKLMFASYIGKSGPQSQAAEWWASEVERRTNGRVTVQFFYQGALLPATDILKGVADGRAGLGYVANAYHPAELPLSSVVGVPFVTWNAEAQMRAFTELYKHNAAFRGEWEKQGVHVLFFYALPENIVGTRDPFTTVEWLKRKRIRGLGYINQALQLLDANPVAIAATDLYDAMKRGTLDAYSGFVFDQVPSLKLNEVAPYTTALGSGNYVFAVTPISSSTWKSMPDDLKKILTEVSDEFTGKMIEILGRTEDEVCATLKKSGSKVAVLPDAEVAKIKAIIGDKINKAWIADASKRGADAENFFKDYTATLAKYEQQSKYVSGIRRCVQSQ